MERKIYCAFQRKEEGKEEDSSPHPGGHSTGSTGTREEDVSLKMVAGLCQTRGSYLLSSFGSNLRPRDKDRETIIN